MVVASHQELVERIWSRDPTIWTDSGEEKWLGWLDEPKRMQERAGELRELVHSLSASEWQAFRTVRFPAALPHVFVGLKVAGVPVPIAVLSSRDRSAEEETCEKIERGRLLVEEMNCVGCHRSERSGIGGRAAMIVASPNSKRLNW